MAVVKTEEVTQGFQGMSALPAWRQVALLVGIAASVALGVAAVMWSQEPDYSVLMAGASDKDMMAMVDVLDQMNLPYQLDRGTGALLVPADQVYRARLQLAKQGLPRSGDGFGFELLQEEQSFGTSRLMETARHNRAMEGELARTIAALEPVRSARVHIAKPKASVFVREQAKPSASVIVDLVSGGRNLGDADIAGIVHLVAASVPELDPARVTVVDQKGRLLSRDFDRSEFSTSSERLEYTQELEKMYRERILNILGPIVGPEGVRAQVAAEIDFTRMEEASENYSPDENAIRSEQTHEEVSSGNGGSGGIPGALTNQPPPAGVTDETATATGGGKNTTHSRRELVRNYEMDRTFSHSKRLPGEIRRITAAVVIDQKRIYENGVLKREAFTDDEIARLTDLVKEAIGFDVNRGDSVKLNNVSFIETPVELPEETPIWQEAWVWDIVKRIIGPFLALMVLFGLLKPLLKNLASHSRAVQRADMQAALPGGVGAEGGQMALANMSGQAGVGGDEADFLSFADEEDHEKKMEKLRGVVKDDPARAAQVVKGWLNENG